MSQEDNFTAGGFVRSKDSGSDNSKQQENQEEKVQQVDVKDDEVAILEKKLADLQLVADEQKDKLLRSLAEIENLRKRSAQDLENANKYAVSKFVDQLILVVENFYLAIENMPKDEIEASQNLKNFALGVTMTQKELIKTFENNGVKRIYPSGQKFDHNYHEAIAQVEGGESGIVSKVIQSGYIIHDRLIRPALVEVFQ